MSKRQLPRSRQGNTETSQGTPKHAPAFIGISGTDINDDVCVILENILRALTNDKNAGRGQEPVYNIRFPLQGLITLQQEYTETLKKKLLNLLRGKSIKSIDISPEGENFRFRLDVNGIATHTLLTYIENAGKTKLLQEPNGKDTLEAVEKTKKIAQTSKYKKPKPQEKTAPVKKPANRRERRDQERELIESNTNTLIMTLNQKVIHDYIDCGKSEETIKEMVLYPQAEEKKLSEKHYKSVEKEVDGLFKKEIPGASVTIQPTTVPLLRKQLNLTHQIILTVDPPCTARELLDHVQSIISRRVEYYNAKEEQLKAKALTLKEKIEEKEKQPQTAVIAPPSKEEQARIAENFKRIDWKAVFTEESKKWQDSLVRNGNQTTENTTSRIQSSAAARLETERTKPQQTQRQGV